MTYLYLLLAVIAEVVATTALKSAEGFTRLIPSMVVVVGYGLSFYFLSMILQTLPLGVTYAVWSGLGIVLVTIAAVFLYKQTPDAAAIIGMALIIAGVAVIQIFSDTTGH